MSEYGSAAGSICPGSSPDAAPTTTGTTGASRGESTTSASTTVMLSGPPDRRASCTNRSAASSTVPVESVSAMVSVLTGSDRPSEHSRYRSPTRASRMTAVGSTGSPVRALRMSERRGWVCASSAESSPRSTSDCTNVSSLVIWLSAPSRSRYARESPTWISPMRRPSNSNAVAVQPIPSVSGCVSTWAAIASLPTVSARVRAAVRFCPGSSSSSRASAATTNWLAISPAA